MDELELVRQALPEVGEPSESTVGRVRARVLEATFEAGRPRGLGWFGSLLGRVDRWPRWTVSVSAAAVVLPVVVMLIVVVPSNAPSAAAEVLLATAGRAEAVAPTVMTTVVPGGSPSDGPGVRYTRWENASLATLSVGLDESYSALVQVAREMWLAPDGSGRISEVVEDVRFLSEEDRIGWERFDGDLHLAVDETYGPGSLPYLDYELLPTDPEELEDVLAAMPHGDWPDEVGVFWAVQDLLRDGGTPPELRGALYRVVAQIEGIELMGETSDRSGRPGTGVALSYEGNGLEYREWMIFDRESTELLGTETVLLTAVSDYRAQPPVTISWFVYLESDLVDRIP